MEIIENVYQLDCSEGSHIFLIKSNDSVLIDTGMPGQKNKIITEIERLNIPIKTIKKILLTHHDIDHIGNAIQLQEATQAELWAPKEDVPYINGEKNRPGLKGIISTIMRPPKPIISHTYNENQSFGEIQVIHAPGHTPGHSIILYRNVLFIGDLFRVVNGKFDLLPRFMSWHHEEAKKSISILKNLNYDWICPSHGMPVQRGVASEEFLNKF
ncbi:MBL fold metallo-hydrolase [Acetobacterium bakii]|uniref:Metallo-beta-lactamase domain-containing protein n=1 Tax=Acetobacterium bakii TaxID=52689 RepID=A0A0L6U315_9FIRM|nr:MBL fold metallo-hydrolase [Acetobacterium bakii]KNZ42757.1 hypothetical protein AKG39_04835 [Acetobacterium bakii]